MSLESPRFYEFGAFRLSRAERRLFRQGKAVPVAAKTIDVLLVLVESPGQVIERAELIKRVWPRADSADGSLAVTISSLRKTLGDRPDGGSYIETLPRQGYRFAATVTASLEALDEAPERALDENNEAAKPDVPGFANEMTRSLPSAANHAEKALIERGEQSLNTDHGRISGAPASVPSEIDFQRWAAAHKKALAVSIAIAIAAIAIGYGLYLRRAGERRPQVRRLAILPFRNLKPDESRSLKAEEQTDFLGPSLADATTTMLRNFSSLIVRPSSYVEKYRGMDKIDPRKVAGDLDVDTLMTGTYLKEGNTLRVTVQLINVNKGEIISRYPFETKYEKLVTVQDQVARNIIDRLQLNLSPAEAEQLRRQTTENPLAYEYFLRGTDMYSRNEFLAAVPLLEKAVELDPNFAIVWAHLGRAYTACASFNLRGRELQLKAQAAYEQALALNPDLIEATVFMANLFTDSNRVEQAVPLLRKLLQANPNIAEARWELGYAYRFAGMLNESIEESERARAIDPNVKRVSSAPNGYLYIGQYEEFLRRLPSDDAAFLVFYRGMGNYYLKRSEQAAVDFDRAYEMDPQLYTRIGKTLSYAIKNQNGVAFEVLRDIEREIEQKGVGDAEATYKVAQAYAVLGEKASALRVLRRSIETGFFCYDFFKSDPLLDRVRGEPEYSRVLEIARDRHERFKRDFF